MTDREKLHAMIEMIAEPYLIEAKHDLGALVSKTLDDQAEKPRRKK
jgi:hypothetical protein